MSIFQSGSYQNTDYKRDTDPFRQAELEKQVDKRFELRKKFEKLESDFQSAIAGRKAAALQRQSEIDKVSAQLPWEGKYASKIDSLESSFFGPYEIEGDRWNQLFPYRFLVIDVKNNNSIVSDSLDTEFRNNPPKTRFSSTVGAKGLEYLFVQEISKAWEAPLPISPQQLVIEDQFAINTSATMRGIVEEHNGIKFKNISASGTFGIWPTRPTEGGSVKQPSSFLGQVFGNTVGQFNNLVASAQSVKTMFDGAHPNQVKGAQKPDQKTTGYYHALYLGQFLERYAQAKRRPENKGWRLVFDIPKQNQSFVVTPVSYKVKQSKEHPNEMKFDFRIRAWKRIDLFTNEGFFEGAGQGLPKLSPTDFQNFINSIGQVRRTLGDASNLVKSVRSDFQRSFNVLRQTSLALKDAIGVIFAVADLPRQVIDDFKSTIEDSIITGLESFQRPNDRFREDNEIGTLINNAVGLKTSSSAQKAGVAAASIASKNKVAEGLSSDQISSGSLGQNAVDQLATDPVNNIFKNPEENFDLFDGVNVDDLTLNPAQEEAIEEEIERIRLLTVDDFRDFKQEMLALALDISNSFGAGDSTYSNVFGTTDPRDRPIPMSIEENEVLDAIFSAIQVYDRLTATKEYDDLDIESPLEYVGGLADESGIEFLKLSSKVPVPVPFGSTIEEIAARYMEDADKWLEIVTLNGLRSPYIDEVGFIFNFQSNGDGRQFTVLDSEDRLFLGQKIILQSDTVPQFSRKIINLEEISENNFLVSVDGQANLDNLTTNQNARMQGFLPGTVNSQNQIYIPISDVSNIDDRIFEIPNVSDNQLSKLSKVDFLLSDSGDIVLNSIGDFRLATGLTNLIQALKMKIRTRKGTLLRHLDYGLGIGVGFSTADFQSGEAIKAMNRMIQEDPRFASIGKMKINLTGSTLAIDMTVQIANNSGVLPISLNVPIR